MQENRESELIKHDNQVELSELKNQYDISEEQQKEMLEFSRFIQQAIHTPSRVSSQAVHKYAEYSDAQVDRFLRDPRNHARELRQISRELANRSPHYQNIVSYYPRIAIHCPVVEPIDRKVSRKKYNEATDYVNMLRLPSVLNDVYSTCFVEDVFFGIEFETDVSYKIYRLDPDYCRISSIEHNVLNFEFDFSYFNKTKNHDCDKTLLDNFELIIPGFFKDNYEEFKKGGFKNRWFEIPSDKSVCLKLFSHLDYPFPPFVNIYSDIDDIQDYKKLTKVSEEQNNYKLIGLKIPTMQTNKSEKADHFGVKMSTAKTFYEMTRYNVDDSIGVFMTPFDASPISFNNSKTNSQSKVEEATNQLFDSVGLSRILFNSDNSNAIKYSILHNDALIFMLNRQVEDWITRKLYYKFKRNNKPLFELKMVDATENNKKDVIDELLKLAQYGLPMTARIASIMGMSQTRLEASNYIENEILDISNTFIPLSSSHTQSSTSSNSVGGRPTASDEELSASGAATRELGSNNERGGIYQFMEDDE